MGEGVGEPAGLVRGEGIRDLGVCIGAGPGIRGLSRQKGRMWGLGAEGDVWRLRLVAERLAVPGWHQSGAVCQGSTLRV